MSNAQRKHRNLEESHQGTVVAWLHNGQAIDAAFFSSMLQLIDHDHRTKGRMARQGGWISFGSSPRIASSRNTVVKRFLQHFHEPEWLLMLDSDMTFPADVLDQMFEHADSRDCPVLGGLCFTGGHGGPIYPTLYKTGWMIDESGHKKLQSARILDFPRDALVKVDATGAAALLVHRSVLVRMFEHFYDKTSQVWFAEVEYDMQEFGEDFTFFMRCLTLGIPIHVHTGIRFGHRKMYELTEELFDAQEAAEAEAASDYHG